jgi:hypothetical protein
MEAASTNRGGRISYTFLLNNVVDIVNRVVKRAFNEARKLPFFALSKKNPTFLMHCNA